MGRDYELVSEGDHELVSEGTTVTTNLLYKRCIKFLYPKLIKMAESLPE